MGRIVIACFRPKPGQQDALRALVATHVSRLRALGLVTQRVPIAMEAADGSIVEVFEWVSEEAIQSAHGNPAVHALWGEFAAVCDYVPVAQVAGAEALFTSYTPVATT